MRHPMMEEWGEGDVWEGSENVKVMPRLRALGWALALFALGVAACGGRGNRAAPTATLSSSIEAQRAFQEILKSWVNASREARIAMEPRLRAFRVAHPDDPLATMAAALLAWVKLEAGDFKRAAAEAARVQEQAGPGTIRDLAQTIEGAALRRQGKSERALALLDPLVSKLIDPYARALLNEEVVASALGAKRFRRALELMGVWLRESGADEHEAVVLRIDGALTHVPPAELMRLLELGKPGAELGEADQTLHAMVAQRLATIARERRDAELAQRLIEESGALLGEHGDAVAELATGTFKARIEPGTVGLLLSLGASEARQRTAAMADGVAEGLDLRRSKARLISRDDQGSPEAIEEALVGLSAEGASVVIAGVDAKSAEAAARVAEAKRLPVILLYPPPQPAPGRFTFVLGLDPVAVEAALAEALVSRGAGPVAILAQDKELYKERYKERYAERPPSVVAVRACDEASAPWQSTGAKSIVLNAGCARDALSAAPGSTRWAVGFEAGPLSLPAHSLTVTTGLLPVDPSSISPALGAWMKNHATPPDIWAALGRDAARLAWAGVSALDGRGTQEPEEVLAARAKVVQAIEAARLELWSTGAKGFGGEHVMPRTLGAREL